MKSKEKECKIDSKKQKELKTNRWPIVSITPFSLIDFPDTVSCILWFTGCNFKCSYCYNPDIVLNRLPYKDKSEILNFLERRKNYLEGVVFSGGECTIHDDLLEIAKEVKALGYRLKLDTNGTNPDLISSSLPQGIFEFVSLDYKSTFNNYRKITGYTDPLKVEESLKILIESNIKFEVRTTVHSALIDEDEVNEMIAYLSRVGYKGHYYLQNFKHEENLADLCDQKKKLDLGKIKSRENINIGFRNF